MQELTLINKNRDRIKIFKPFEYVSKPSPSIDAMEIQYACVYKDRANQQLQNLLKELQTHLYSGGCRLMTRLLKEEND